MGKVTIAAAAVLMAATPSFSHEHPHRTALVVSVPAAAAEAAATVDAFHAALRAGEGRTVLALLTDDALVFEAGGVERGKDEYAAQHLSADMAFATAVPFRITARSGAAAGPFAWIASEGRTTGRWKGKPVDRVTTETMLLRKSGAGWKIVHIHWSSAAAPAAN